MAKGTKYTNQPLGTFDGHRHYVDPITGNYVTAGLGGAKGNKVKTHKNFARTRENYEEYGICAKWTHLVRKNLLEIIHLSWGNYTSWINQMAKNIQKKDIMGIHGQRSIKSSLCKSFLTSLNFNMQHPFKQVLTRDPEVIVDLERKTITVNIPNFYPWYELNWPKTFSYYRFSLEIGQQSDYLWDKEELKFKPEYPGAENSRVVVRSEWMSKTPDVVDISLTASFADDKLPKENVTVLVGLGIEIGRNEAPGTVSFSKGDGTMAIIACF